MTRIRFEDLPSTNTPRNAENLNKLNNVVISPTEPTTGEEVWIQKGKNLLNPKRVFGDTRYYSVNEDLSVNMTTFDGSNINEKSGVVLPAGTYTISCFDRNGAYLQVFNKTLNTPLFDSQSDIYTFTLTEQSEITIKLYHASSELYPTTIHIMLEQGETATSYEPYINKKIYTKNDNDVYEKFYDETNREIYSTGETKIGTWLGKPLYRKVIDCGNLPNATTTKYPHGLTDYSCVRLYGVAIDGENSAPIPYHNDADYSILLDINTDGVRINTFGVDRSNYKGYVTIEYTKN